MHHEREMSDQVKKILAEKSIRVGPTGRFPQGKLTDTDEGEIIFAVGTLSGKVIITFGVPVATLGMNPKQARAFARCLHRWAASIERGAKAGLYKLLAPRTTTLEQQFAVEYRELKEHPGVFLKLTAVEAWALMAQIQLATRHPANNGPAREVVEAIARQIQTVLATTPALAQVAEMGWDPGEDVEV